MNSHLFFRDYMQWHYGAGVKEFWQFWKNILRFGYHYFSIPLLARTIFTPLYRIHEQYPWRSMNMELIFQSLAVNLMSRIIGAVMRTVLIAAGIAFETVMLAIAPVAFLIWISLPFLSLLLVAAGVFIAVF